jgi:hypothetical protein
MTVRAIDTYETALRYCREQQGITDGRVTMSYASETEGWHLVFVAGTLNGVYAERVYAVNRNTGEVR